MSAPDPSLWRLFNIQLRLLGLGATFAGLVTFLFYGLGWPPPPGELARLSPAALVAGLLLACLGLGFLMLAPYRPDLGDAGQPFNPLRRPPGKRRWWTGDQEGR